jgi:hypothetical protein
VTQVPRLGTCAPLTESSVKYRIGRADHLRGVGAVPTGKGIVGGIIAKASRRRAERVTGLWYGRYKRRRFGPWEGCRVSDVSTTGAAVEVDGPLPDGGILLEIRSVGSVSDRARLRADIRNHRVRPEGGWRVGVEFVDPPIPELASLLRMMQRHSV